MTVMKCVANGKYVEKIPVGLQRAKELALETLQKELDAIREDGTLGLNGSGDVSDTTLE